MKEIKLTLGLVSLVDDEDFLALNHYKWHARKDRKTFYASRSISIGNRKTTINMHSQIMGTAFKGHNVQVDHIDGNSLNNTKTNLRVCNNAENSRNKKKSDGKTSKYKGVSWFYINRKWSSKLRINGSDIHLGYYKNEIEAAIAYNIAAIKYFGRFASINDIPEDYKECVPTRSPARSIPCWTIEHGSIKRWDSIRKAAIGKLLNPSSTLSAKERQGGDYFTFLGNKFYLYDPSCDNNIISAGEP